MNYAIITCINGSYHIQSEGYTNLTDARVSFHGLCQSLWNASDIETATVQIVDQQLDVVSGYREFITHLPDPVSPDPEPIEE